MLILTYCKGQGSGQAELECRGAGLVQGEWPFSKCKDKYKWFQKVVNPGKY